MGIGDWVGWGGLKALIVADFRGYPLRVRGTYDFRLVLHALDTEGVPTIFIRTAQREELILWDDRPLEVRVG